jgi:hypothetical protein
MYHLNFCNFTNCAYKYVRDTEENCFHACIDAFSSKLVLDFTLLLILTVKYVRPVVLTRVKTAGNRLRDKLDV